MCIVNQIKYQVISTNTCNTEIKSLYKTLVVIRNELICTYKMYQEEEKE